MKRMGKLQAFFERLRLRLLDWFVGERFVIQSVPDILLGSQTLNDLLLMARHANRESLIQKGKANLDFVRFNTLRMLLERARNLPTGDYAEVGMWRGSSAKLIWNAMPEGAALFGFDTFEGFSSGDSEAELRKSGIRVNVGAYSDTSVAIVRENILGGEANPDKRQLHLVKGYFPDSASLISGFELRQWRFIHLDCDLYKPIREGLALFWPRIVSQGYIVVHDYNSAYKGAKEAVDEFAKEVGVQIVPVSDKSGSVVICKP